jgi:hypothetical protein
MHMFDSYDISYCVVEFVLLFEYINIKKLVKIIPPLARGGDKTISQ